MATSSSLKLGEKEEVRGKRASTNAEKKKKETNKKMKKKTMVIVNKRNEPPTNESFTVPHKTTRISTVCGIGCLFPNGDSFPVISIIEDEGGDPVFSSKMKRRDSILTRLKAADKMKGDKLVRERKGNTYLVENRDGGKHHKVRKSRRWRILDDYGREE